MISAFQGERPNQSAIVSHEIPNDTNLRKRHGNINDELIKQLNNKVTEQHQIEGFKDRLSQAKALLTIPPSDVSSKFHIWGTSIFVYSGPCPNVLRYIITGAPPALKLSGACSSVNWGLTSLSFCWSFIWQWRLLLSRPNCWSFIDLVLSTIFVIAGVFDPPPQFWEKDVRKKRRQKKGYKAEMTSMIINVVLSYC